MERRGGEGLSGQCSLRECLLILPATISAVLCSMCSSMLLYRRCTWQAKSAAVLCTVDSEQLKVLVFKAARDDTSPAAASAAVAVAAAASDAPNKDASKEDEPAPEDDADNAGGEQPAKTRFRILQSNITDSQEEDAVIDCVEEALGASRDTTEVLKTMKAKLAAKFPGTWQVLMSTNSEIAASAPSVRMVALRTKNTHIVLWQSTQDSFYEPSMLGPLLENLSFRRLLFILGSLFFLAHLYLRMTLNDCCLEPTEAKPLSEKCVEAAASCTPENRASATSQQWWSKNLLLAMMVVFGLNIALKFTEKKKPVAKKRE